jgi:Ser-tRNA(Ala) deacylase AlaX
MEQMDQLKCSAVITEILQNEDKLTLLLDQTVFCPQGGGQPYDTGVIVSKDGMMRFLVQEVRFVDGYVHHIGHIENENPAIEMTVSCSVDEERRTLNSQLHSAGHVIDLALKELGIDWIAGKGYHFPQGAYVEYSGNLNDVDTETLKRRLEEKCKEIIDRNIETTLFFDAEKLQNRKPIRIVYYGNFGIACGGTHVANLKEIGKIEIRKIKKEKENIRVSYSV